MARGVTVWFLVMLSVLVLSIDTSNGSRVIKEGRGNTNGIKSATFFSPMFELGPGSVENRYYYDVEFPRGHIAIKSFNAEVIDEQGNPVPLHETYLHHWVMARYYQNPQTKEHAYAGNSGICQRHNLDQYFGLGSETRKTETYVPDPYGIEVGNPPAGYEEKWLLNVHAIDTRGVENRLGCTECRCDLYNVTIDEYGRPVRPDYKGGLLCCYDHMQCRVAEGFQGTRRKLFLRYTVQWVDWDADSIIPVRIYILDVTDIWKRPKNDSAEPFAGHNCRVSNSNDSAEPFAGHNCRVEYDVEACGATTINEAEVGCIDTKRTSLSIPDGGYVIYGVAHQHTGGVGSNLFGEDGHLICSSVPEYGKGNEAGDEAGYIVGMSTCYPQPGTVKIANGEALALVSLYSSSQGHTGVMGLFYLLVADQLPSSKLHSQG